MSTDTKTRTITLTGRAPVRIVDAEWPQIASATGDSYSGSDYARHQQALGQGECDRYSIRVRQHADGRTLVYAVRDAADRAWQQPAGGIDWRGGELLEPGADIARAIERVGSAADLPAEVIRECVADLPPVAI